MRSLCWRDREDRRGFVVVEAGLARIESVKYLSEFYLHVFADVPLSIGGIKSER